MQDQVSRQHAAAAPVMLPEAPSRKPFFTVLNMLTLALLLTLAIYPWWADGLRVAMGLIFAAVLAAGIWSDRAGMLCRTILPVLIGAVCVEFYIVLQEWETMRPLANYFTFGEKYTENFYAGISTLYAIITALALVKGIEDFDAIRRNVAEEAYKVRAISDMTHYFDDTHHTATRTAIRDIREKLARYAANVAAHRDVAIGHENIRLLRDCQLDIGRLKPEDENDSLSLQNVLTAHNELGILRAKRISAMSESIPNYLIAALWLVALALILPFMAEPLWIEAPAPQAGQIANPIRFGQYFIIFVLGALNSFLLLILKDISDRFDGYWRVDLMPFEELHKMLAAEPS
jgi:hypothetical protein